MLRTSAVDQRDTHRLIPAQFADGGASVLARLTDDPKTLDAIFELDNATNDRLLAESQLSPALTPANLSSAFRPIELLMPRSAIRPRVDHVSILPIAAPGMPASSWRLLRTRLLSSNNSGCEKPRGTRKRSPTTSTIAPTFTRSFTIFE